MKFKGNYNFYVDGKSVTVEDVFDLVTTDMTASIKGLDVFYSSPKKEKLEMAQKFKEKALEEMGIKDTESKKQSSQSYYTNAEQYEILYKICMEQIEQLIEKESRIQDSQEPRQLQFDSIESNSEDALRKAYGDLANIFKNEDGNYQINFPQKKNKTEELLEEVNKHQEQNGGRLEGVEFPFDAVLTPTQKYSSDLFVPGFEFIPKRGKIIKYDKSTEKEKREAEQKVIEDWNSSIGITFNRESLVLDEEDNKKYFDNLDGKIGKKENENKVDYGELDWDYIDGMALRMTKNLAKYSPKNWQKKIEIKELAKSAMRHARKILQEIDGDEETLQDHAIALGNNGMMINYQIKLNKDLVVSK